MIKSNTFKINRKYSEINGLQKEHYITYCITTNESGIIISVTSDFSGNSATEKCLFPNLSFKKAQDIATLLSENGYGIDNWLDIFEDLDIDYVKIN